MSAVLNCNITFIGGGNMAQALIGGRVIILECENNQSLISLYEKHGYKLLDITDETNLKTMYVAVADVQQLPNAKS